MVKKLIFLVIFTHFSGCFFLYAQTQRICATPEYDKYLRSKDPAYAKERDEMESKIAAFKESHPFQRTAGPTVVIPVVVHVVWKTPDQNISDEQIISQLDVLNEDYTITNANIVEVPSVWASLVGSSHLFFSLARKNESGIATNGIERRQTNKDFFTTAEDIKHYSTGGSDAWNRDHFLNIWVCNLKRDQISQEDLLGYAQLPGSINAGTDGIVIHYLAFGRVGNNLKEQYNLGRTATHEIGHWFNLTHIWGDDNGECTGTDYIADTPNQGNATFGCPSSTQTSCNNVPDGDMFQNYMDYTDDKCMMLFTADQRSRMDNAIMMYRDSLNYAAGFTLPINQLSNDIKISNLRADKEALGNVVCKRFIEPVVTIQNEGLNPITSFSIQYAVDNDTLPPFDWTGTLAPGTSIDTTLPKALISQDLHTLIANITSVNGANDDYKPDNFKTRSFLFAPSKYGCIQYGETPEIIISPNPSSDAISIETKYKESQKATLSIYNILGKRIYTIDYLDSTGELLNVDVKGLANGIYFVAVKTFNKQGSKKFVINHP